MKLDLPVNYTGMIKWVCDMAESEFTKQDVAQIHNYYVLVLMMAGVIDDL